MRRAIAALGTLAVVAGLLLVAQPAAAAQSTTTTFDSDRTVSIGFGDDWLFSVHVAAAYPSVDVAGTVSLYAGGLTAPIARSVPVQPGGDAYLAAPAAADPLAPGTYVLTAIFTPAGGAFLESSKTRQTARLTVSPAQITADAELIPAATTGTGSTPTVQTALSGSWIDRFGPPAGEWAVAVLDPSRTKVYAGSIVQPAGAGASTSVQLPLPFTTRLDTAYEVIVGFYPNATSASGVQTGDPVTLHFTTAAPTFADTISTPVATPVWAIWAIVVGLVLLLALLALVIVLVVRDRRSRYLARRTPPVVRATSRILLYDEDGRVLLFLTKAPDSRDISRWITPGGGVEEGETHDDAALRELYEETGLDDVELVGPMFSQDFIVEWDAADHDAGHVEFYVAQTQTFDPSDEHWTDDERVDVLAHRWFTAEELEASGEPFEPVALPDLIRRFGPADHESMDA